MTLRRLFFCHQHEHNTDIYRTISINASWSGYKRNKFANKISSTKYKWYSFIPKGLYEQFRRVANIYFAFHAAISLTPVTPVNPITTIIPLAFVIGVAMGKEGIEDLRRGRQDKDVNNRMVYVLLSDGSFKKCRWREVNVGDVVKVLCDEYFPADLLFLFSTNPNGTCYVETANLDGETNLKLKKSLDDTSHFSEADLKTFNALVKCEQPNPSIYTFSGSLTWREKILPLGPAQILLRGSKLRNTPFVYGAVLYTGFETKIMLNATDPPSKRSSVEHTLDYIIVFQLLLLLCMSTVSAAVFSFWLFKDGTTRWYLQPGVNSGLNSISKALFNYNNPYLAGFLQFFTCLVLYGYFVPISLYVSMEIVKILQAMFISSDIELYYKETDKPASARTSNLNEELGQVSTILSDKTGTLTRNEMEFFKCSIAGISYGTGTTEVERVIAERSGKVLINDDTHISGHDTKLEKGFSLRDRRLENLNWLEEPTKDVIRRFLEILAICNTVVIEKAQESERIKYIAESPDEASFVVAAKSLGVFLCEGSDNSLMVRYSNKDGTTTDQTYQLLNTLEFNSVRKRMSVIVRNPEGCLLLFCKGAEDAIFERLGDNGKDYLSSTRKHMNEHAEAGLRTLAFAYRKLDKQMYSEWQDRWQGAKEDIMMKKSSVETLSKLEDEIECDLTLVGATAIEDKLQVGVPQTIFRLAEAGIKIWVLTGDKMGTAINIGYACSLLRQQMSKHIVRWQENGGQLVSDQIKSGVKALTNGPHTSHALIIDGKALNIVLEDEQLKIMFTQLASNCESVICCRVSPLQKAIVTEHVRFTSRQICLAIGDGANDVGMIQKANIGVGISGVEGQQAAMSSDFSIAQFRFLEKLLLVHGAWCYKRTTFMIKYFFYKNFVFGFSLFLFNAYTRFSGQSIYADWFLSLYNVIFTAGPVVVIAVLDQDLQSTSRLRFPQLYNEGRANGSSLIYRMVAWMLNGVLQAAICFFSVIYGYGYGRSSDQASGYTAGLFAIGTTMYTCVLLVVNIQVAVVIQYWTWIHHFFVWGELVLWFCFLFVAGELPLKLSGQLQRLFVTIVASSWSFYIITLSTTVLALLPSFTSAVFKRNFNPSDYQIVQQIEKQERLIPKAFANGHMQNEWEDSSQAQEEPFWSAGSELGLSQHETVKLEFSKELEITEVGSGGSPMGRNSDVEKFLSNEKYHW